MKEIGFSVRLRWLECDINVEKQLQIVYANKEKRLLILFHRTALDILFKRNIINLQYCNIMVSLNITDASLLCLTWKASVYFGVCISIHLRQLVVSCLSSNIPFSS